MFVLGFACASYADDNELTFNEILDQMEEAGDYSTMQGEAVMKIINSDGDETVMAFTSYEKKGKTADDDDSSLIRFTSPARLKGTAILVVGDNIWYYNNRTNRVRLLSQSAKKGSMMGSGFSYEDLELQYSKDFTGEVVAVERDHYKLKLIPKKEKNYSYMVIKTRKEDFQVELADYFNENDLLYKKMVSKDFTKIKSKGKERVMPMVIEVKEIEDGKVTRIEFDPDDIKYDIKLDDDIFSERALRQ